MSSILNSISAGNLEVQQAPQEKPVKEDSIIELLQTPEIEFEIPKKEEHVHLEVVLDDVSIDTLIDTPKQTEDTISDLLENVEIELTTCPTIENDLENVNTGFGGNNDVHYETPCTKPKLKVPLYRENYLSEFVTEEEKAAARHALGLYNRGDIVAMSMLTSEDSLPSTQDWEEFTIKQLRKGDKFFSPVASFSSIFSADGTTLDIKMEEVQALIAKNYNAIEQINQVSNLGIISSLGDVKQFLQGFSSEDNLKVTLDNMNQEMLRFEKTGQITT